MKAKLYPAFLITGIILLTLISLRQFLLRHCTPSTQYKSPEPVVVSVPDASSIRFPEPPIPPSPVANRTLPLNPGMIPPKLSLPPLAKSYYRGSFRVSNLTEYPVRVTLLTRSSGNLTEPVHWDFAPAEGSREGLILSLPREDLVLQSGDILAVFAADGSRYYWGPYIVGETSLPAWNPQNQEWELLIEPN